jgi:hypothetical protein
MDVPADEEEGGYDLEDQGDPARPADVADIVLPGQVPVLVGNADQQPVAGGHCADRQYPQQVRVAVVSCRRSRIARGRHAAAAVSATCTVLVVTHTQRPMRLAAAAGDDFTLSASPVVNDLLAGDGERVVGVDVVEVAEAEQDMVDRPVGIFRLEAFEKEG